MVSHLICYCGAWQTLASPEMTANMLHKGLSRLNSTPFPRRSAPNALPLGLSAHSFTLPPAAPITCLPTSLSSSFSSVTAAHPSDTNHSKRKKTSFLVAYTIFVASKSARRGRTRRSGVKSESSCLGRRSGVLGAGT